VDLEAMERPLLARALVDRFFPPEERRQLQDLEGAELRRAVLESWVLKEAAIKWRSGSLAADLRYWSWDRRRRLLMDLRCQQAAPHRCELRRGWLCAAVGEAVDRILWV
jgi:phosphopantetheinyl transferase